LLGVAALAAGPAAAAPIDLVRANTTWRGVIHQGAASFPTVITVAARDATKIRGEIDFQVDGKVGKLSFRGDVLAPDKVVWTTTRLAGAVTAPGLYFGKISGDTMRGEWRVPSANQDDRWEVQLVR
jgi:hypothetical protein